MHHSLVPFLNFKRELYSKDKMIDKKNDYYIKVLIRNRDLEFIHCYPPEKKASLGLLILRSSEAR